MRLLFAIAATFVSVALSGTAFAGAAEDIIAKEKCSKCHTATTTKKGDVRAHFSLSTAF